MRLSYFALMYSGDGNRKYKMTGTCELHEPRYAAMTADLSFDDVVLYPNPYITVTPKGYTKHYFMGAERFCTTIGGGNNGLWLVNPIDHLTQDEANLLDTLENSVFYTHYYYDLYDYHHCHSHTENTDYTGTVMPNDGVYELYQYTEDEQTLGTVTFTFYSKFEDKFHEYSSENNNDEPYYYHSDHLGSAAWITDKNGLPVQYLMYAPYGEQLLNQQSTTTYNERFTFTGKERDIETGYDYFGARNYLSALSIWGAVDPLADTYIQNTPYIYCDGNPIKYIDPDGRSTKVVRNDDDTYTVFGGDLNDGDLHIYEYTKDKDGNYIKGHSIGVSTSTTSFYNSDTKTWGGIIYPNDMSGQTFLGKIFGNKISLADYMQNAHGKELYDFKHSNGTIDVSDDGQNMYRGMPFGKNQNGEIMYSSARDIGNIAAGYIAGSNGISWGATRIACDFLQSWQDKRPSIEGRSSRNAQYLGWCIGFYNNSPLQQSRNTQKSLKFW